MKYTKKDVEGMFKRLCTALNKRIDAGSYNGLSLDYISCYGGYVIVEYDPVGGESHPFGLNRRNIREMYLSMLMTTQMLEAIAYKKIQDGGKNDS